MINKYEQEGYFDDELPDYDELPTTPTQLKHAESLVGKWVISQQGFPYGRCLGKVTTIGHYRPSQIEIKVFRSRILWDFRHWTLMWQESITLETSDSSWWSITEERPTLKEQLGRIAYIVCRTPVKKFHTYKFDLRTYHKFGYSIVRPDIFESLVTALWDVLVVMRYGWQKFGKWSF